MSAQAELFPDATSFSHAEAIAVWRELWRWPVGPERTIAFGKGKRCALACPWCEKRIAHFDGYESGETMLVHSDGCEQFVHVESSVDGKDIKHVAVRVEKI